MKNTWIAPPTLKKIIFTAVQAYRKELNFDSYTVDINYKDSDIEVRGGRTGMDITTDGRYLRAIMNVYPCMEETWKEHGVEEIRSIVAHEMAHMATNRLAKLASERHTSEREIDDADEELTEVLGRFLYNAVKRKKK